VVSSDEVDSRVAPVVGHHVQPVGTVPTVETVVVGTTPEVVVAVPTEQDVGVLGVR